MPTTCQRCGNPAQGYATINNQRYCHGQRNCYTEQSHEQSMRTAHPLVQQAIKAFAAKRHRIAPERRKS